MKERGTEREIDRERERQRERERDEEREKKKRESYIDAYSLKEPFSFFVFIKKKESIEFFLLKLIKLELSYKRNWY